MIPHGQVENALLEAANAETMVLAVTAVPDDRKGEQLVVLHTLEESNIPVILEKLSASGMPNLFIPKRDNFIKVNHLPVLGTGKLDLRTLKKLALEKLSKPQPAP
jgi:acyl-[acyl-carrier-protein]-phospholipid O-acyltransferase/long-chain-fatty-acid--[acyl-carrier-protein] ligase